MAQGDKRDYPKIDIFLKEGGQCQYVCSTTWAKTCKEAVQHYKASRLGGMFPDIEVKALFSKKD